MDLHHIIAPHWQQSRCRWSAHRPCTPWRFHYPRSPQRRRYRHWSDRRDWRSGHTSLSWLHQSPRWLTCGRRSWCTGKVHRSARRWPEWGKRYGDIGEDEGFLLLHSPGSGGISEGGDQDLTGLRVVEENGSWASLAENLSNSPIIEGVDNWSFIKLDPVSNSLRDGSGDGLSKTSDDLDSSFRLVTSGNMVVGYVI